MASALNVIRFILHISALIILTISLAFALAAILTAAWQTYQDPVTQEIHQHGLWFDYTRTKTTGPSNKWEWQYKFGQSVEHDEIHKWRSFQYNTLILFSSSAFLAFLSTILSCMAPFFAAVSVIWAFVNIWPAFLSLAAVIIYFDTVTLPEYNHVLIDNRRMQMDIGYSFYFAVVATAGFGVSLAAAISAAITDVLLLRRGERWSMGETYLMVGRSKDRQSGTGDTTVVVMENQSTSL